MNPIETLIDEVKFLRKKLETTSLDFISTVDLINEIQKRTKTSLLVLICIGTNNINETAVFTSGSPAEVMGLASYANFVMQSRIIKDLNNDDS